MSNRGRWSKARQEKAAACRKEFYDRLISEIGKMRCISCKQLFDKPAKSDLCYQLKVCPNCMSAD
jgi:ribosomal protein S25